MSEEEETTEESRLADQIGELAIDRYGERVGKVTCVIVVLGEDNCATTSNAGPEYHVHALLRALRAVCVSDEVPAEVRAEIVMNLARMLGTEVKMEVVKVDG